MLQLSRILALALCGFALGGCPEAWRPRGGKTPVSALWIGTNSQTLEASDLARLKDAGIEELIVTVAELDLTADDGPLVRIEAPDLPSSMPVTLAVRGAWQSGSEEPSASAERVAEAARQLRFALEGRGGVPVGLHFDLSAVGSFETLGEFLAALRKKLDRTLFLSVSLKRDWLQDETVAEAVRAVDFVVPFLYGQRIEETEDPMAWDFVELERKLQVLEEMDTPYMLGVVSLGTASHLGGRGEVKARATGISLKEILWNRNLKLRPGFSLEGVNRRVYQVMAEKPAKVGKWSLKPGEMVRVVRAATSDLEELMRLLGAWEMEHHLGQVYYRLPGATERLSLSMENLLNALDSTPASPDLHFDAHLQRRTGRGWLVRFSITNENGEITELALMDSNYLDVRCANCIFGQRVDAGDFYRYDLYRSTDGELERTFRRPNLVRLHVPILEGQQKVTSGDVEVYLRGEPELELSGQFLLPSGRALDIGPLPWPPVEPAGADAE